MSRRTVLALTFSLFIGSISGAAHAAEAPDQSYAPVYDGPHVLPLVRAPGLPADFSWSGNFMNDTNLVLRKYGWYLAEMVVFVDASGQVRDVLLTESIPAKNLSATIVDELRRKTWTPADGPSGPVPGQSRFRIVYDLQQSKKSLGAVAGELRRNARSGKPSSQYLLSRVMKSSVGINREGFDVDTLLRQAAEGGERRAMLAIGSAAPDDDDTPEADRPTELAHNRAWLLKAAHAGSGTAQLLVALHSWAEGTDAGYARARHWLESANQTKEPAAAKYLAALLVSHSSNPEDWKQARRLAESASQEWHDRSDPDTLQIVAAASALTGDFKAAIEAQTNAMALAGKAGWSITAFETRLAAYQSSRTVTDDIVMIPVISRDELQKKTRKKS